MLTILLTIPGILPPPDSGGRQTQLLSRRRIRRLPTNSTCCRGLVIALISIVNVCILLRLEELFRQLTHFSDADGADGTMSPCKRCSTWPGWARRPQIQLIRDLERQRFALEALRDNPAIAEHALDEVLGEIESAMSRQLEYPANLAMSCVTMNG